jgi:O-antigen/teichoic acid export membrane protein
MLKEVRFFLRGKERESAFVGIGNLLAGAIGGIFWLLLASIVKVNEYGQLNYYISLSTILSALSLLGLNLTIMTYLPKGEEKLRHQSNLVVLISNAIIVIPLIILTQNFVLSVLLVGTSFFAMTVSELLGRKSYRKFPIAVIGQRLLQFVLSLGLYYLIGIDGILLGYGLSLLAFSYNYVKDLFASRRKHTSHIEQESEQNTSSESGRFLGEVRRKSKFILHTYLASIAQSFSLYADKLVIAPLFGFSVLGNYQLGFQFLLFLSVIPVSLTQYLLPQESSGVQRKGVRKVGVMIAIIMGIAFFFSIEIIIGSFFPEYISAIAASRIMILGIVPMSINAVINSRLLGTGKSRLVLIGSGTYLFSLFSLMIILGGYLQLTGLAIALVTALSIQTAVIALLQRRHDQVPLKTANSHK